MTESLGARAVAPGSNAELVRRSAARTPGATALVFGERSYTYAELWDAARGCASELAELGVQSGDRVAVLGRNSDRYVIAWLATQLIAAVHVPVNFMLSAREVGYIVGHSQARIGLADAELLDTLREGARDAGADCRVLELCHPSATGSTAPPEPAVSSDTLAQIAYTSGTESSPKGAMLSHGSLQAQYLSCIVAGEFQASDVILHALPLYHCAQLHVFMMPGLALGARNVLVAAPAPDAMIDAIAVHGATSVFAPPTVWISLLANPRFDAATVGSLAKGYYGAAIMPVHVIGELSQRLPHLRLWNLYGQTEMGPLATSLPPEEQLTHPGSAGRPALFVQTRVVDDELNEVAAGDVGEVVHRSPQVMLGYFRDPERTEQAFAGGWFHSGDLATRDANGYITIVDRKKDMIKTGGENVSSREVEEVLFEHPAVEEVAVIAVADDHWIEAVCAVVVLRSERSATEVELRAFVRARLAGFKTPKRVVFVDALPKNPSGKILKRELRDTVAAS
jgi:fatty-acyl-CoA synthase